MEKRQVPDCEGFSLRTRAICEDFDSMVIYFVLDLSDSA